MALDQSSGYLYFVYYDRRRTSENATETYISYSMDGGETFTDLPISKSPFTPDPDLFFGDYLNIDAVKGQLYAIWPELNKGEIELFVGKTDQEKLVKHYLKNRE
jgi:hypothetical protein